MSLPEIFHSNSGNTISTGSVRKGQLTNAYLLPYSGANFKYFSPFSYYILNNAYVHHDVYSTILDAYKTCHTTCPDMIFRLMETSNRNGGRMHFPRTHQNGFSADFMSPKINSDSEQTTLFDWMGLSHYLLEFDSTGKLNINKGTKIDFETMAKHILSLDEAAKKHGLRIRKVILKISLKDNLYATQSGKEIKKRGIYIVRHLTDIVDKLHDDHYHIDFEKS